MTKTNTETKKILLKCSKNFYCIVYIYMVENYMKDLKESSYHGAIISALAIEISCNRSNVLLYERLSNQARNNS